jgi:predicted molibdopterin-dependent oxidoreductase YjgC
MKRLSGTLRLPLAGGVRRGPPVVVTVDGRPVTGYAGESVAAVLFAEGITSVRTTVGGEPRGVFCGMGVCFDCLVVIDGVANTRACMTWISDGMRIELQAGLGPAES